jgi:DNA-binding LacI/PurR family transcriptional regulator
VNETKRPGGKPATINDIARLAEVSKKTVSRVINHSPFVKEETRRRVEAVIAEHGYSPDPQARGLAFRRSFLVGMIYDNPSPNYVVNMQQGVLDAVRGSGLELVVHPCNRASDSFLDEVRERGRGFREGLAEHGLTLDDAYVRAGAYTFESGVEAARALLAMSAPPTAIFAGNDEMAIGVMKAARDAGLDVPGDLSIVGFDDLPMASRVWPNLTTVRLPIRDMGRMAAEKLTAGLRGLDPATLAQPEVDPSLVVRDSTAGPRPA